MKVLSGSSRQNSAALPTWAALDQESLRISSALEYIDRHGNLDRFSGIESENRTLMAMATHQGLVTWNRNDSRYELTSLGRQRLGASRAVARPAASAVPASRGTTDVRTGVLGSGVAIAMVVGVVAGAALMALMSPSSKMGQPDSAVMGTTSEPSQGGEPASAQHRDQNGASPSHAVGDAEHRSGVLCLSGTCPETGNSATAENAVQPEKQDSVGSPDGQADLAAKARPVPSGLAVAAPPASSAQETQPPASFHGQKTALQTPARSADTLNPERTVPAQALPRRTGTGSKATRSVGHHVERAAGEARARSGTSSKTVGYARSAAEPIARAKRDTARSRPGRHEPQQTWGSAKTANVTRVGLLVREERKLADGTALVRYQYGNGPPRFEVRGIADRGWGRGLRPRA
jgi:hypothetical protein